MDCFIKLIASPPAISGGMIENPKAVIADLGNDNAGKWVVNLDMTAEGRKKWSRFTAKNINRKVAIVLDNEVFMAPTIRDKITAGSTQISGFNDMQEAKNIASILKAGELPAPINAVPHRNKTADPIGAEYTIAPNAKIPSKTP